MNLIFISTFAEKNLMRPSNEVRGSLASGRSAHARRVLHRGQGYAIPVMALCKKIKGFQKLQKISKNAKIIELEDVRSGAELAYREMRTGIFDVTFRELSPRDKDFLFAMLEDDEASLIKDVAERMGVKGNYAGQYKKRLLADGVIGEYGRGSVRFELPGFREYLLEKRG